MYLVSLAGRGDVVDTTKISLSKALNRSMRTIQKYISELHLFEYINRKVRISKIGWNKGLKIFILNPLRPFFKQSVDLVDQILMTENYRDVIQRFDFIGETETSHYNTNFIINRENLKKTVDKIEKIPIIT